MFSAAECLIPNDELKNSMKRETLGMALLVSSAEKGNAEACLKLGRIFYAQKKSTCKHFAQYFLNFKNLSRKVDGPVEQGGDERGGRDTQGYFGLNLFSKELEPDRTC